MKTDIKRLKILRDSYIREREKKINEYETLSAEGDSPEPIVITDSINFLTAKINSIDEKIGV